MAFNIWEHWPWSSFQNLNLDWLMKAVKEATIKAEEASESVGQFDDRITANTEAIDQLSTNVETISSPARVLVSAELQARYRGNLVTGSQLLAMMRTHGDLPFVEYNGEVYMLDTPDNTGDLRFSMTHTTLLGDVTLRHITIFAQSSDAAYSVTNVGGGGSGSSGNVFAVTLRGQAGGYVSDHTYAEIYSQMEAGRIPVLLVEMGNNNFTTCPLAGNGSREIDNQTVSYVEFVDTSWLMQGSSTAVGSWRINSNGTVTRMAPYKNIATLAYVNENAILFSIPQVLTLADKTTAQHNIGIHDKVVVEAGDTIPASIRPGIFYDILGQRGSLALTLSSPEYQDDANEYHVRFHTAATPAESVIILPSTVHVPVGFGVRQVSSTDSAYILSPNTVYEISILDNYLSFQVWEG